MLIRMVPLRVESKIYSAFFIHIKFELLKLRIYILNILPWLEHQWYAKKMKVGEATWITEELSSIHPYVVSTWVIKKHLHQNVSELDRGLIKPSYIYTSDISLQSNDALVSSFVFRQTDTQQRLLSQADHDHNK